MDRDVPAVRVRVSCILLHSPRSVRWSSRRARRVCWRWACLKSRQIDVASTNYPIVFVHSINGSNSINCSSSTMGRVRGGHIVRGADTWHAHRQHTRDQHDDQRTLRGEYEAGQGDVPWRSLRAKVVSAFCRIHLEACVGRRAGRGYAGGGRATCPRRELCRLHELSPSCCWSS